MNNRQENKREDLDFRILSLLQENPNITQREIAGAVGISLGSINYCLKALIDKGQIKIQNFRRSEHKLQYAYLLTPAGLTRKAGLAARFLVRKMQEYERLKAEIESVKREDSLRAAKSERSGR